MSEQDKIKAFAPFIPAKGRKGSSIRAPPSETSKPKPDLGPATPRRSVKKRIWYECPRCHKTADGSFECTECGLVANKRVEKVKRRKRLEGEFKDLRKKGELIGE